mmetsp:Transcript_571/g.755  ORF Transcript_571/g.755 Transcript_571/m.755 type:complete len:164 (+) Transcript_571:149-640(+)|eukprot:CAMPEP_0198137078 /NCGR_PEP_ID=MMETSP1443-20131203/635_1 /TAXON_ID=186043 /ORGANISM="Entomoneis sp., Strain CCMP2396" /LENGTH=163 /DNA_ID=CAMNT_0043798409 /DNA_START=520 /DNA_END=1011 /DNA_ORIENTATION=-
MPSKKKNPSQERVEKKSPSQERLDVANFIQSALDSGDSFDEILEHVIAGATFQCDVLDVKLASKKTIKAYWIWHKRFVQACPDSKFKLNQGFLQEKKRQVVFLGTWTGTHTEVGGPVEPTGKSFSSHIVHILDFNEDAECTGMTKIWNDAATFRDLGWPLNAE